MYRGWTQTDYQNKRYNINQNDEGTLDDRRRDGGTNFILRIKEQETRLTLQEHDDDERSMTNRKHRPLNPNYIPTPTECIYTFFTRIHPNSKHSTIFK